MKSSKKTTDNCTERQSFTDRDDLQSEPGILGRCIVDA